MGQYTLQSSPLFNLFPHYEPYYAHYLIFIALAIYVIKRKIGDIPRFSTLGEGIDSQGINIKILRV